MHSKQIISEVRGQLHRSRTINQKLIELEHAAIKRIKEPESTDFGLFYKSQFHHQHTLP